jgi:hypothetical protein
MIDDHLADIEKIRKDGGIVLIKWDGERTQLPCTVVVSRQDTNYIWHKDCQDIGATLREAIGAYAIAHAA